MKKTSSFAIADKYLKSSTAGPLLGAVTCEQIAEIDSGTVQAVLIDSDIRGGTISLPNGGQRLIKVFWRQPSGANRLRKTANFFD